MGQRSPPRATSPNRSLQKSPKVGGEFQDQPPNLTEGDGPGRAQTEHELRKSHHKSDLQRSKDSIRSRQSALARSQKSLVGLEADPGAYDALPTEGENLVQDTQGVD